MANRKKLKRGNWKLVLCFQSVAVLLVRNRTEWIILIYSDQYGWEEVFACISTLGSSLCYIRMALIVYHINSYWVSRVVLEEKERCLIKIHGKSKTFFLQFFSIFKLHSWLLAFSLLWRHLAWIKCFLQFQPQLFEFPVLDAKKSSRRGKLLIRGKGPHSFSALHCASLDIQFHLPAHCLLPPRKLVQVALSIAEF